MTQIFTIATDNSVNEMIASARYRLAVIAPGVTTAVANALAARMSDLPGLAITIILDADPEVYRMGYGDPEALTIVQNACKSENFILNEHPGVRIGVIISDDRTMVYSLVCRNVEAGSKTPERPNAITLAGAATNLLAVASGMTPPPATNILGKGDLQLPRQEIGRTALLASKVDEIEADLKRNPPRSFDLSRRLTVFTSEVQFSELKFSGAILSKRKIRLLPHFLKFKDEALRQDIESTLKIPLDFAERFEVTFESSRYNAKLVCTHGKTKSCETMKINEADLESERQAISRTFLHDWKGRGLVIFRKDKEKFDKEIDRLLSMTAAYQAALTNKIQDEKTKFRKKIVAEFLPFWIEFPPDNLKRRATIDEETCEMALNGAADEMFDKAVQFGVPGTTRRLYKDLSFDDLKNETLMEGLKKLMAKAGVDRATLENLFQTDEAIGEKIG